MVLKKIKSHTKDGMSQKPINNIIDKAIHSGPYPKIRDWRKLPADKLTRAERVMRFGESYCFVPEGALVGKNIVLSEFQQAFFYCVYDNEYKTKKAYLSIARKNAKSATIAIIILAHLVGPEAKHNSQIISGARSRDQAALVFKLASKMVMQSPELMKVVKIIPSSKALIGLPRNVEYKAIAADGSTAHGLSPVLAILDEVGQVRGSQDDFIDAITTSQGAHDAPLLIAISTQAPNDNDLFSIWLDDAKNSKDKCIVSHVYEASKDCDVMDEKEWKRANPALGIFRSYEDLKDQAVKAERMPSSENTFRNLCLNQRVEANNPFVSRDVWSSNGEMPESLVGKRVYAGLDLSSVNDLTALVLVSDDGDVVPYFWLPADGLSEKSKSDRVPYDVWAKDGYLLTTPGRAIEYEYIAEYLRSIFDTFDIVKLAFDRYNMRFLKPYLEKAGFTEDELERFIEMGQGFVSMSPAIRELESSLLSKKLKHGNNPVLTMCASNASVIIDPAGNRKFTKQKSTGRIDGMVSLAMAVSMMPESIEQGDFDGFLMNPVAVQ